MEDKEKRRETHAPLTEIELQKLSNSALLKELQNKANDKPSQDKICNVLLQKDTSQWATKDLLKFLRVCPKNTNNGKAVEHAERALFARVDSLGKDELLSLLDWTLRNHSQEKSDAKKLINLLLEKKLADLEPKDMFYLLPMASPEQAKDLLTILFNHRYQLSGVQLLQLSRMLFTSPPSQEIQEIMNALYEREMEREKIESGKMFGFVRPSYHTPPHDPKTKQADQPSRYFVYFQPHPTKQNIHFLDVTFNPVVEQQIHTNGLQSLSYGIVLTGEIPQGYAVEVYFSLPPFSVDKSVLVGYLSPENPLLPVDYPLPIVGAVTAIRIAACIVPKDKLKNMPLKGEGPVPVGLTGYVSPIKRFRAVGGGATGVAEGTEVTVCNGETHVFKVGEADDFDELLKRACRRWNVGPSQYELQDENFKTLNPTDKVSETIPQRNIIRLAKKGFGFAPPAFPVQQQQDNVFSPFQSPFQPPFGQKNLFDKP